MPPELLALRPHVQPNLFLATLRSNLADPILLNPELPPLTVVNAASLVESTARREPALQALCALRTPSQSQSMLLCAVNRMSIRE